MNARELRERRGKIAHDMAELANKGLKTAEERTQFDALDTEQAGLKEQIDRIERADKLETETRASGKPPAAKPGDGGADEAAEKQAKYAKAFRNYLRAGVQERMDRIPSMTEEDRSILREFRDTASGMGTGGMAAYPGSTGTAGGFFVPVGFSGEIETALKYYGPMLSGGVGDPTIFETASGQPLPWPTVNDTGVVGELIGENTAVAENEVTVGQVVLGAFKYSTKMVKVSLELLQDSAFNLEAYLKDQFATRLGRILNTHFTTGTGTSLPWGIAVKATAGPTAVGSSANTGGNETAATSIGSDDLTALEHSVDILYRRGAKYMMHDTTVKLLKQLKDKYGRPLWLPGIAVNAPDTINGYPYLVNNDMDVLPITGPNSPVTTKKTILFGYLPKYLIRRVKDLSVLRLEERYAEYGQVAFIGFARYDGTMLDAGTNPVKYLASSY